MRTSNLKPYSYFILLLDLKHYQVKQGYGLWKDKAYMQNVCGETSWKISTLKTGDKIKVDVREIGFKDGNLMELALDCV
jgi:hypothetical protein